MKIALAIFKNCNLRPVSAKNNTQDILKENWKMDSHQDYEMRSQDLIVSQYKRKLNKIDSFSKSPIMDSGKKTYKSISSKSTPQHQRYLSYSMKRQTQTTAMKRRRKRDPTINRRGLEMMDPYLLVRNEIDMLKSPNQSSTSSQTQYSKSVERWWCYEYFYSSIDKWYFSHNQFKELWNKIGIEDDQWLKQLEWSIVRSSFDKVFNPTTQRKRRFSDKFIEDEKNKLNRFRDIFREIMQIFKQNRKEFGTSDAFNQNKQKRDECITSMICSGDRSITEQECKIVLDKIDEYGIIPFEVGQRVLAKINSLHTGTILASEVTSAYVQFDRADLSVIHVKDINMITFEGHTSVTSNNSVMLNDIRDMNMQSMYEQMPKITKSLELGYPSMQSRIKSFLSDDSENNKDIQFNIENTEIDQTNIKAMGMLNLLLERKAMLIEELRRMNRVYKSEIDDLRVKNESLSSSSSSPLKSKYAWVSLQLLVTNAIIEPVLSHFRMRKIKSGDQIMQDDEQ